MLGRQIPYEPGKPDMVTLSAGVVSCKGNAISNVESLVQCADDALYQAKSMGRNRVVDTIISDVITEETPGEVPDADAFIDVEADNGTDTKHLTMAS
jgi:hypothetical protein